MNAIDNNGFIRTANFLPFEDKAFPKRTPLLAAIRTVSEEEMAPLYEQYDFSELYRKYMRNNLFPQKAMSKDTFARTCWKVLEPDTGKVHIYPFMLFSDIGDLVEKDIANGKICRKDRGYLWKYLNKPISHRLFDTEIINGILIFRFFKWEKRYFNPDHHEAYYETHRICFKGTTSWGENRETTYRYNPGQVLYKKGIKPDYARLSDPIDAEKNSYNFYRMYPASIFTAASYPTQINGLMKYLEDDRISFPHVKINKKVWKEALPMQTDFNTQWFLFYLKSFYEMHTETMLHKNTPDYIVKDLKNPCIVKNFGVNNYLDIQVEKVNDTCFKVECGMGGVSVERAYYTKDKVYTFAFNHMSGKWVSTKREKLFLRQISCSKEVIEKLYEYHDTMDTIFKRYVLPPKTPYNRVYAIFNTISLQEMYPAMEQAAKLGFRCFINEYYNISSASVIRKEMYSKRLQPYGGKHCNLSDFLGISGKMFKNLDKGMSLSTMANFNHMLNSHPFNKIDKLVAAQLLSYNIIYIYDIVDEFEKEGKDPTHLFRQIIKTANDEVMHDMKESGISSNKNNLFSDSPHVYGIHHFYSVESIIGSRISHYSDYLTLRKYANKLGNFYYPISIKLSELNFMHDKAMRDDRYYRLAHADELEKEKAEAFKDAVTRNDYKTMEFTDDSMSIISPETPADLVREGSKLHHCVGGYTDNVIKGESKIYFLRRNEKITKPYYTLEVRKSSSGKWNQLTQCYTTHDSINKDKATKDFINKWAEKKGIEIHCTL